MRTSIRGFGMNNPASNISRLGWLAGPLAPAPCAKGSDCFATTQQQRKKHFAYLIASEPEILDPAKFADVPECISPLFYSRFYFQHPFGKGIAANTIAAHRLQYAWIDTTGGV